MATAVRASGDLRHETRNFDPKSYLVDAGQVFKGKLADANKAVEEASGDKAKALWEVLNLLICYAGSVVFKQGDYTRKKAAQFKEDVMGQLGISAKQAGKWTESISAALGVRGLRKGVKPIEGLMAVAKTGVEDVDVFLKAREISTFNQFMNATRVEKDAVQALARQVFNLSQQSRERLRRLVEKLDKDAEGEDEEDDDDDSSAHARAP